MKKIILTVFMSVFVLSLTAQNINWVSLEEAVKLQKKEPKKIMVDVYTSWCGPCKMLDKNTFQNKDVADYINEHYYAVKFNGEGDDVVVFKENTFSNPNYDPAKANRRNSAHQLTGYFRVSAYPTMLFLDEKADLITPIRGYKTPQQLELYLKLFKDDAHKNMDSQEKFNAYAEAFKPEFKS